MDEGRCARIRRYADEAWNRGCDGIVDELFLPGHQYHDHFVGGYSPGPEGVRQHLALYREAFPDGWVTVEDMIDAGDKVAVRWLFTGTHSGPLRALPATGRRVATTGVHLFRFVGERVGETWAVWDSLGLVQQLGLVPPIVAREPVLS
jgi:steroid delta-isomerase-like uncharacterized protein